MRITFVLPGPSRKPSGGPKVIYEYADRLVSRGHQVTVVHPINCPNVTYNSPNFIRLIFYKYLREYMPRWYRFRNRVNLIITQEISDVFIPDGEAIFATAWVTAEPVQKLSSGKGKKFYLIQHYEIWGIEKEIVESTYRLGLYNIVVSEWIEKILLSLGNKVTACITNGIDFEIFNLKTLPEERDPYSLSMMYHPFIWKGADDGLNALKIVKDKFPRLKVKLFSVYKRPKDLPSWIEFIYNPDIKSLVDIYNRSSIFISPSWAEGFGLPAAESMACGCALATTDSGGPMEFAIHNKTALVSKPRAPEDLAENIISLLEDNELRLRIAYEGNRFIIKFTWDNSVSKLEDTIMEKMMSRGINRTFQNRT